MKKVPEWKSIKKCAIKIFTLSFRSQAVDRIHLKKKTKNLMRSFCKCYNLYEKVDEDFAMKKKMYAKIAM